MKVLFIFVFFAVWGVIDFKTSRMQKQGSRISVGIVWAVALVYSVAVIPLYKVLNPMIVFTLMFGWVDRLLPYQ